MMTDKVELSGERVSKFGYFFNRVVGRTVTFAVFLLVLFVTVRGFAEDTVKSSAQIDLIENTTAKEVVFSASPESEESFLDFNGVCNLLTADDLRVNCDLAMLREGAEYKDNLFGFCGSLPEGHCAVSKNLLRVYGLKEGDTLKVRKTQKEYVITELLSAQPGTDTKYSHEGVIILGYDGELASKSSKYLSFVSEGDQYTGLEKIVFVEDIKSEAVSTLFSAMPLLLGISVLAFLVCELLLQRKQHKNYSIMAFDGVPFVHLCKKIWADLLLKYFTAVVLVCFWCAIDTSAYGGACFTALLPYVGAFFGILTLTAIVICRRMFLCRKTKK